MSAFFTTLVILENYILTSLHFYEFSHLHNRTNAPLHGVRSAALI